MEVPLFLVLTVILIALAFDFTNGFHDAANAIATVVATEVMTMKQALVMAAVLNVLGAFVATAVAQTIESGIIEQVGTPLNAQIIVLSALLGAIGWNLITWVFAMPSSSSHAIVGGLVGAGVAYGHSNEIIWTNILDKVVVPMLLSPLFGLVVAGLLMLLIYALFRSLLSSMKTERRHSIFKKLQIFAGALMAFSHGSNDAQKTMGVITLALVGANLLSDSSGAIPFWVILLCALAMGLGTLAGGKRIIETAGHRITRLENESGFAANIGASITILICSRMGLPVSTTHVVAGSITGAGLVSNRGKVNLTTWRNMVVAWVLTLPGAAGISLILYLTFERFLVPLL